MELVRIRLIGELAAIETIVQALRFAQQGGRFRIHEESEFYESPRRRRPRVPHRDSDACGDEVVREDD